MQRTSVALLAAASLATALLGSACSKTNTTANEAQSAVATTAVARTTDPCQLATSADAAKILGASPDGPTPNAKAIAGTKQCFWKEAATASDSQSDRNSFSISTTEQTTAQAAAAAGVADRKSKALPDKPYTTVDGIGDGAVVSKDALWFAKGKWSVGILVNCGGSSCAPQEQLIALAKTVDANLG